MKFGVVVFPGSNCDSDVLHAVRDVMGQDAEYLWHKDHSLKDCDCIILPGGFSYGDYLRVGAIAQFSPLMDEVIRFAGEGGLVLGICNGFQILLETGLLPGAMKVNDSLHFVCKDIFLRVENTENPFTNNCREGEVLKVPVAHGGGNYYADPEVLKKLEENKQVVFRYATSEGEITAEANPNGSEHNIAGIMNEKGNVLGMMPHPERCVENLLGGEDGKKIFSSLLAYWQQEVTLR